MVYDCFTFFNELDLLEIRLNILNEVVDKFVLCEAAFTHQGNPKPLYYQQNKERYTAFNSKIIYVVVNTAPLNPTGSAWVLEMYQRQMLAKGLEHCAADDIIIVSDLDEIPNPDKINTYKYKKGIKIFEQRMYYYFLNNLNVSHSAKYRWCGSVMAYYKDIGGPQWLRNIAKEYINANTHNTSLGRWLRRIYLRFKRLYKGEKVTLIKDGGWHFSYLGGTEMIIKKLEAFAHAEYNTDIYKNEAKIEDAINNGKDIFNRPIHYKASAVDEPFPKYIMEHKEKYKNLIK